jgi:hypothetical protein
VPYAPSGSNWNRRRRRKRRRRRRRTLCMMQQTTNFSWASDFRVEI